MKPIGKEQAEKIIKALAWKAEKLESEAIDVDSVSGEKLRADAQFLREKVSQMKGERIPLRDDEGRRALVLAAITEHARLVY